MDCWCCIVIIVLIFSLSLYQEWKFVDHVVTIYSAINTTPQNTSDAKCSKWQCRINNASTCWNISTLILRWNYDFTMECESRLINVIPKDYKQTYEYIILNLYYSGETFSLYLNSNPIDMIKYETNDMDGEWLISSNTNTNKNKISINDNNVIKFIYTYKQNRSIVSHTHFHLNYIGYDDNKDIYSPGVWSIIPNALTSFENNCNSIGISTSNDWSPCKDEYLYSNENNECIIYSIGISNEYQFDISMTNMNMGCTLYMFDCRVKYDYNFSTNAVFYPWCLIPHKMSLNNNTNETHVSIIDIIKYFKHENKIINIFKIDCEGCEYDILNDLMNYKNNFIKTNIKQIYINIELHTFKNKYMKILSKLFNTFKSNNFFVHKSNINCGTGPHQKIPHKFEKYGFLPYCRGYKYQFINNNLITKWIGDYIPHYIAPRIVNKTHNQKIPKRIIQTWKTHNIDGQVLRKGIFSWINLNPDYEYYLFDNDEADEWIKLNYNHRIYSAYNTINPTIGAAKADLWRYLIINKLGGIYADIDTQCMEPLNNWIYNWDEFIAGSGHDTPAQFALLSIKNHLILNETIKVVLNNIDKRKMGTYVGGITGPAALKEGYINAAKHNMFHEKKDFIIRKLLNPTENNPLYMHFGGHIKMKMKNAIEEMSRNGTMHWSQYREHTNLTHIWTDLNRTRSTFTWY
eukprot:349315_1